MNEKKVAEKIRDLREGIESIVSEIDDRELQIELDGAYVLFKYAADILTDSKRILDAKFSIHCRNGSEVAIESSFGGVHLHTEFLPADTTLETVMQRFTDSKVVMKSAIALLIWALRDSAQTIMEWHVKHY